MNNAEAIANGTAMMMAMVAVMTEPTNIAAIPNVAVDVSSGFRISHFDVVRNFRPKSEKISKPRYNKNAAIKIRTTSEDNAAVDTKPRNTLSTGVKYARISRWSGGVSNVCTWKVSQCHLYPKRREGEREVNRQVNFCGLVTSAA